MCMLPWVRAVVCSGVLAALSAGASSVLAQTSPEPRPGEVGFADHAALPLTKSERIAQVVAELNARAVEPKVQPGSNLGGGREIGPRGPAAWTVVNEARGIAGCSVDVAMVHSGVFGWATDVYNKVIADPRISSITMIDAGIVTPDFGELLAFDSVMCWSLFDFANDTAIGDALAAYVDAGGGVVLAEFAIHGTDTSTVAGRFASDNYYCIERTVGSSVDGAASLGTVHVPVSPLMEGVGSFNGGGGRYRPAGALHPNATRIASWNTGEILVATRFDLAGRRVDLGFFPPSSTAQSDFWDAATDGDLLMANALVYAGGCPNVGLDGCEPSLFVQVPTPGLQTRNSNTKSNAFTTQQFTDDFVLPSGGTVHRITLWAAYTEEVTQEQRLVINIHNSLSGVPHQIIYTVVVTVAPQYTGDTTYGTLNLRLYRFTVDLPTPFTASPGATYWLSPLGDINSVRWSWQISVGLGTCAFRSAEVNPWSIVAGSMAFELCGVCDCNCPGDADFDGDVDLDDLQLLLFFFGTSCW
jgi:hypothetical protein